MMVIPYILNIIFINKEKNRDSKTFFFELKLK
jgi:hypothetical protein